MTSYDAGHAFLQVTPSWRGWDAAVTAKIRETRELLRKGIAEALPAGFRDGARASAPEGAKAGEQFGGAFAQAVRRRIEAGLKALPKVEINADSSDTDVKIAAIRAQLEELRDKRIGIDIDEGLALAQLAALQAELDHLATEDPSVAVRIDAARASEELAAIQAEVNHLDGQTATVNVRVNQTGELAGAAGGLGLGGLGLLGAGAAASPLAVPLGAGALGGLGGLATVAGSGAGALTVLTLGLSNVKQAVTDIAAAHNKAGSAAAQSGVAQARAALSVLSAERQVQNAIDQQATAERNLTDAQARQKDAQQALTDARKQAAQQIADLNQAVTDGALTQRQAELDVTKARLNLQNVNSDPLSTQLDRQQARLDYDTAVQRQKDLATQQQRTVDAAKAANKAGVDGSNLVIQAQQQVATANQQVADAYKAVQKAADNVAFAYASLKVAQMSAATAGSAQFSAMQQRIEHMSPAVQKFAGFINSTLKPAFSRLRDAIQASLLPDLQTGLTNLIPMIQPLSHFMAGLAKVMGDVFVEASKALESPFWQRFFDYVSKTAGPTIKTLSEIIGNVFQGFAGLVMAWKPVSDQIGTGLLALTGRFADFASHLDSNKGFQAFLAYVIKEGPAVAHFFGDLFSVLGNLLAGLAPLGAFMLDLLNSTLDLIKQLGPEGLLLAIGAVATAFAVLAGGAGAVVIAVVAFAGAVTYAYQHVKPFHDFIQQHVIPIFHQLHDFFVTHLMPVLEKIWKDVLAGVRDAFDDVRRAVERNRPQLQDLYDKFKLVMTFIVDKVLPIVGPVLKEAFRVLGTQISTVIEILGFLDDAFNKVVLPGIRLFVKLALGAIGLFVDGAAAAFGWIPGLGPKLKAAAKHFDEFAASVNTSLAGIQGVTVAVIPGYANPQDLSIPHRYADGGAVIGLGSWTADSIPALLSNGEHVWPAREVAALGGQQAMYQLRRVLTGYAAGGSVGSSRGLMSAAAGTRAPGLARLNDLAGRSGGDLYYEQHLHYPIPDSVGHGQMRAQQLLLHELSNR